MLISADSGPLHIANSVGTQTIGIYGPTRLEITGVRGPGKATILKQDVGCNKAACYHLECQDNICMQSITPQKVLNVFRQIKN